MRALVSFEIKKNMKDRGLLFWMILLPIAFIVLATSIFTAGEEESVKAQYVLSIVPGYTVMFVFYIMLSIVTAFLKDRNSGMTARIASTPLRSQFYLLGKWIPYILLVWMQIILLLTFGKLVYQIPIEQPFFLLLLSFTLSFTATGFGLLLALLVQTENMGIAITQVVALGGAMLGGLWMPIELMPSFIQSIATFLPQYWAHQGFQEAMMGSLRVDDLAVVIAVLFSFGIGSFVLAWLRYPRFLRKAKG